MAHDNKQPKTKKSHAKPAAAKLFAEYTYFITGIFLEEFGWSYATTETVRGTWRQNAKWSPECEDFLLKQTRLFIRTLDSDNPNHTNLQFMEAFVNDVVDYLSKYFARNPSVARRKDAKETLKGQLFINFTYFTNMANEQAIKRARKHAQEAQRRKAQQAYNKYTRIQNTRTARNKSKDEPSL